jgi:Flp pilus assembly protein TadD
MSAEQLHKKALEFVDAMDFETALKFIERALTLSPNDIGLLESMGTIYLELQRPDDAQNVMLVFGDIEILIHYRYLNG